MHIEWMYLSGARALVIFHLGRPSTQSYTTTVQRQDLEQDQDCLLLPCPVSSSFTSAFRPLSSVAK